MQGLAPPDAILAPLPLGTRRLVKASWFQVRVALTAITRRVRISGSYTFVSLNSRLKSNKEEEKILAPLPLGTRRLAKASWFRVSLYTKGNQVKSFLAMNFTKQPILPL